MNSKPCNAQPCNVKLCNAQPYNFYRKRMNKVLQLLLVTVLIFSTVVIPVSADRSEKAQVIKFNNDTNDLIIKRGNGERWLIQHNRACTSISTEFPVTLIWEGDKVVTLKVNFNEKCKVYNTVPYSGEGKLLRVIRSENQLVKDHEAEIFYRGNQYMVDYDERCRYMYDFEGDLIYYNFFNSNNTRGEIILPGNRGQCEFKTLYTTDTAPEETQEKPETIEGFQHQAQNNSVYFYWKPMTAEGKWLYVISYSRNPLELDAYKNWREMPNIRLTKRNSYTMRRLENGREYHFYIAALNEGKEAGPWTQVSVTPVAGERFVNNPDAEPFEIKMEDKSEYFKLSWPDRSKDSRRYYLRFYVNGKFKFFRILHTDEISFNIPKEPEYEGQNLKVILRTFPKPQRPKFSDGIFWKVEENEY